MGGQDVTGIGAEAGSLMTCYDLGVTKKDTSLDDIAGSISALTSMVSEKFDELDRRLGSNDKKL